MSIPFIYGFLIWSPPRLDVLHLTVLDMCRPHGNGFCTEFTWPQKHAFPTKCETWLSNDRMHILLVLITPMTASKEACGPIKKQTSKPNPEWQVSKQGKTDTKQTNKQKTIKNARWPTRYQHWCYNIHSRFKHCRIVEPVYKTYTSVIAESSKLFKPWVKT